MILCASHLLRMQIPKVQKKLLNLTVFFVLLGFACVKAARRMLVKLTQERFAYFCFNLTVKAYQNVWVRSETQNTYKFPLLFSNTDKLKFYAQAYQCWTELKLEAGTQVFLCYLQIPKLTFYSQAYQYWTELKFKTGARVFEY